MVAPRRGSLIARKVLCHRNALDDCRTAAPCQETSQKGDLGVGGRGWDLECGAAIRLRKAFTQSTLTDALRNLAGAQLKVTQDRNVQNELQLAGEPRK